MLRVQSDSVSVCGPWGQWRHLLESASRAIPVERGDRPTACQQLATSDRLNANVFAVNIYIVEKRTNT
ncbi:hypothetical protein JJD41_22055 [Oxynema sp. CENA135]|uniref:hypothetical protein n=1 Tax=Oxynema sp. CENA135 TaxID=984206 RepID=UPI00190DCCCC|nr:hypothetical protein [Oxynema sp. CENA135]MBK4732527.1 hypothetical protein [Oxynema sp. CENA135]